MIDQEKIHQQCFSDNPKERIEGLEQLKDVFSHIPDQQKAWGDLHRLTFDQEEDVRSSAVVILSSVFFHIPDKQKAWEDLRRLISDQEGSVSFVAICALGIAFSHLPDKQKAWGVLHRLISDQDEDNVFAAALSFYFAFPHISDKQLAWEDLHRLASEQDEVFSCLAAGVIGSIFSYIPDKQSAWEDLHRIASEKEEFLRFFVADGIGSAFPHVSDKQQAWKDLIKLTNDEDSYVRIFANYSLGKACIFKASQAGTDKDYKRELEKAIEFFEKAARESGQNNPAKFCLPFYRSFHTIIFKNQEAKEEINKYLVNAKAAIGDSKSKELLFEVVESLAHALKETQNLENLGLEAKKCELNFYRVYCDRATKLMTYAEDSVPFAVDTIRKGLPILDRNLKGILEEVQKRAKIACRESQGTATEEIACAVNREVQKWEIGSQEYLKKQIESLVFLLSSYVPKIEENSLILNRIDNVLQESVIVNQYTLLNTLLPKIIDIQVSEKTVPILNEIKSSRASVDRLIESVDELQNPQEYLDTIQQKLEEIKDEIPEMKEQIYKILNDLDSPLNTTQKLKIAIPIIPALASYEVETDVSKHVAGKIRELKNLILRSKK